MITDNHRGIGRTTEQLKRLPDGGVFIIHNRVFKTYCERLLAEHCPEKKVRFMTLQDMVNGAWHGLQVPGVLMDHHAFTCATTKQYQAYRHFQDYVNVNSRS